MSHIEIYHSAKKSEEIDLTYDEFSNLLPYSRVKKRQTKKYKMVIESTQLRFLKAGCNEYHDRGKEGFTFFLSLLIIQRMIFRDIRGTFENGLWHRFCSEFAYLRKFLTVDIFHKSY